MRTPWLLLLLGACSWNRLPQQSNQYLDEPLWDAAAAVPTVDGLYVPLPHAGGLALVPQQGDPSRVDLGEGRLTQLAASPDGERVIAFVERYRCQPDDPHDARGVRLPEDCPDDALLTETQLSVVAGGKVDTDLTVDGSYNTLSFSADGRFGIAYVDFSKDIEIDSVLNLTGIVVLDLEAGETTLVPVGFATDRVLFVQDDGGGASQAVVLSRNAVAVVDLLASPPAVTVTFPLTLDPDSTVDPVGVDLTPDGRYALISARGSSDLYVLDLELKAINLVELSGAPAAMAVSQPMDRTVLVYAGRAVVEVMDHEFFDVEVVDLDEGMDKITLASDFGVLWGTASQHDVYRLDLENNDTVEYRLQNPAVSLHLAPTEEFAVALTRAEGGGGDGVDALYDQNPGMEILDLREGEDETQAFILEGQGLGVAFAADAQNLNALVLQQGVDYLYRLDLYTRQAEEIELSAPPVAIGSMPDGQFFITHDRALGLVSFLDPTNGKITEVAGFATLGLMDPIELLADEGEAE